MPITLSLQLLLRQPYSRGTYRTILEDILPFSVNNSISAILFLISYFVSTNCLVTNRQLILIFYGSHSITPIQPEHNPRL